MEVYEMKLKVKLKKDIFLKDIPTYIVHGRYDVDCRPINAYELSKKLNNCDLDFVISGHSSAEPAIVDALVRATDKFKEILKK